MLKDALVDLDSHESLGYAQAQIYSPAITRLITWSPRALRVILIN